MFQDFKTNTISGFIVFLIALPLCLGIASASAFPPVAGLITAIVGGIVSSWLGSARLSIKGPGVGLIVIILGAVQELGQNNPILGYKRTLACGVIAGLLQMIAAQLGLANIVEWIPSAAVHGVLSSIGIIIILEQIPILLGEPYFQSDTLHFFEKIPEIIKNILPEEAFIGLTGLVLLIAFRFFAQGKIKKFPVQIAVLLVGMSIAVFDGLNPLINQNLSRFFVMIPKNPLEFISFPNFDRIFDLTFFKHTLFLFLVGSIESTVTVNALNLLNSGKTKSNLNHDLFSVGCGNVVACFLGGLPMISEIVRSQANTDNQATHQTANFMHGFFMLASLLLCVNFLNRIPLACLASMLIYTGARLASWKQFQHAYHLGKMYFTIFLTALLCTVFIDILAGLSIAFVLEYSSRFLNKKFLLRSHR
jgi:MFS superfamily sulfate permease-like transporter